MCADAQAMKSARPKGDDGGVGSAAGLASWDDLRFVAAVARRGSFLAASAELGVDHTTVGRRVAAAEKALGARLFARSTAGLSLTPEGEALLAPLQRVEDAVHHLMRRAGAEREELSGTVKVTAPESFGIAWLAPRLAELARAHPGLHIDLDPTGAVLDLSRRQAEVALRHVRTKDASLVSRHAAELGHGLYASRSFLARYPVRSPADLSGRPVLTSPQGDLEAEWLERLAPDAMPIFTCVLAVALVAAAKTGVGIAVLPRYLGDAEEELVYLPMPDEPKQSLWITVHKDLRKTPRVRAVLDFIAESLQREQGALRGRS